MIRTQTSIPNIRDAFILLFKSLPEKIQDEIKKELYPVLRKDELATLPFSNITDQFEQLCSDVMEDCMMVSSPSQIALHPSYQKIISMGKKTIPLLIKKLDDKPTLWFWALEEISGDNPVSISDKGNIPLMIKSWKNWAKENEYEKRQAH